MWKEDTKKNKKMKYLSLLFAIVLLSFFVSATPYAIFTEVNLTITNGTWWLKGEGIDATDTFSVDENCNFHYERTDIPITFSREIEQNETDVAILLRSLAINSNITIWWHDCISNLTECKHDIVYESNYSVCKSNLELCSTSKEDKNKDIIEKNKEIEALKSHRFFLIVIAGICGIAAWKFRKESVVRTARSPGVSQLPQSGRM